MLGAGTRGLCVGIALACAIVAYNAWTKRFEIAGALNMGLCRASSPVSYTHLTLPTILRV